MFCQFFLKNAKIEDKKIGFRDFQKKPYLQISGNTNSTFKLKIQILTLIVPFGLQSIGTSLLPKE